MKNIMPIIYSLNPVKRQRQCSNRSFTCGQRYPAISRGGLIVLTVLLCCSLASCQLNQDELPTNSSTTASAPVDSTTEDNSKHEFQTDNHKSTASPPTSMDEPIDSMASQASENTMVMEDYRAVLEGKMKFRDSLSRSDFDISQVQKAITTDTSFTIKPRYIAKADLDADGTTEVILSLEINENNTYGYLILRYQDSVVYGYTLAQREFSEVRTNGTFESANGAADFNICRITFDKDSYSIDSIMAYKSSENGESYLIDQQEVTQKEYEQAYKKWEETPYIEWHELTNDNISLLLS